MPAKTYTPLVRCTASSPVGSRSRIQSQKVSSEPRMQTSLANNLPTRAQGPISKRRLKKSVSRKVRSSPYEKIRPPGTNRGQNQDHDYEMEVPGLLFTTSPSPSGSNYSSRATPDISSYQTVDTFFTDRAGVIHLVEAMEILDGDFDMVVDSRYTPDALENKGTTILSRRLAPVGTSIWNPDLLLESIETEDTRILPEIRPRECADFLEDYENRSTHNGDRVRDVKSQASGFDGHLIDDEGRIYDDEWEVKKIVGERVGPGIQDFRIKWLGWEDDMDQWVPEYKCFCPELIKRFRDVQERELLDARVDENEEDTSILRRLALAARRHPEWQLFLRDLKGQWAGLDTKDVVVEMVRLSTLPRDSSYVGQPAYDDEPLIISGRTLKGKGRAKDWSFKRENTHDINDWAQILSDDGSDLGEVDHRRAEDERQMREKALLVTVLKDCSKKFAKRHAETLGLRLDSEELESQSGFKRPAITAQHPVKTTFAAIEPAPAFDSASRPAPISVSATAYVLANQVPTHRSMGVEKRSSNPSSLILPSISSACLGEAVPGLPVHSADALGNARAEERHQAGCKFYVRSDCVSRVSLNFANTLRMPVGDRNMRAFQCQCLLPFLHGKHDKRP